MLAGMNFKSPPTPSAAPPLPPVFPKTQHTVRPAPKAAVASDKSQSRDTRENRGTRQMKTTHNAQTFPHGR